MYRIRDFSYLCKTSMKTLRHYHKLGLLQPIQIDPYTGYRYYSDEQVFQFKLIKRLQDSGFSLKEIKKFLEKNETIDLEKQIIKIEEESSLKIEVLKELIKEGKNSSDRVEFTNNRDIYIVGKYFKSISRKDIDNVELKKLNQFPKVVINYEKTYKEDDIACLIGYEVTKEEYEKLDRDDLKEKGLICLYNDSVKEKTILHTVVKNDVIDAYNDLIVFAAKNNIQILREFYEIYYEDYIDIYIDAYDLNVENKVVIEHDKQLGEKLKDVYLDEYVGTWQLQGEIIELPFFFDKDKKHYMPDTELVVLELKKDGTTNFPHILWKENYLIIDMDGIKVYDLMNIRNGYLNILINLKYSNARPYEYYYKKIK